jgi:hypothetical protein
VKNASGIFIGIAFMIALGNLDILTVLILSIYKHDYLPIYCALFNFFHQC